MQDLRYALRSLARARGLTATVVAVLALGIGANAAIFSVVSALLLRPLPYHDPGRLVQVFETFPLAGGASGQGSVSFPNFRDWREQSRSFEGLALASFGGSLSLQGGGEPERLAANEVGGDLFRVLGARPLLGRGLGPADAEPGAAPAVVLSEGLWRRRFGADPAVVGRTLTLDGQPRTVVGVMPERFRFPAGSAGTEVWVPLQPTPQVAESRGNHAFMVVGRLRPGVEAGAAEAEMRRIAARLAEAYPDQQEGRSARVVPLAETVVGRVRPALLVLLGAAGLVLLIACANAANLLLSRAVSRRREVAIRAALGAGRRRVARQFLTESVLLAGMGALLGLGLAWGGVRGIVALAEGILPRTAEIGIDARVVAFLAALALGTGVLFGLAPALSAARTDLQSNLRESGRTGSDGRGRGTLRGALVVGQVALSLVLLVGAGLLMRTFVSLLGAESGMRTENVLTLSTALPAERYADEAVVPGFYEPVLQRIRETPGVRSAGAINLLPLQQSGFNGNFGIEGKAYASAGEQPFAEFRVVAGDYFAALGIPVVRGRAFEPRDAAEGRPVALVNQALARRYFPGEDPVGRHLTGLDSLPIPIVGVVGSVRQAALSAEPAPEVYVSQRQVPFREMVLTVRTGGDPAAATRAVREAIRAVDPAQPVHNVKTMRQVVRDSVSDRRLYLWLLGSFAAVALALAVAGIYGVVSYSVAQRTREFGIRLALGAGAADVRGRVLRQGAALAGAGLALGAAGALALTRVLGSVLYGVSPTDPATYLGVAALLGAVALGASLVPAVRATRVDPVEALRAE